jgi:hypothetical protein
MREVDCMWIRMRLVGSGIAAVAPFRAPLPTVMSVVANSDVAPATMDLRAMFGPGAEAVLVPPGVALVQIPDGDPIAALIAADPGTTSINVGIQPVVNGIPAGVLDQIAEHVASRYPSLAARPRPQPV